MFYASPRIKIYKRIELIMNEWKKMDLEKLSTNRDLASVFHEATSPGIDWNNFREPPGTCFDTCLGLKQDGSGSSNLTT